VPTGWDAGLDAAAVLGGEGVDASSGSGRIPLLLEAATEVLGEGVPLLAPAAMVRAVDVVRHEGSDVLLAEGRRIQSPFVSVRMAGARQVVLAVCTIGRAIESRASELVRVDPVIGLAWDGLGTAAVDLLARAVCREVTDDAHRRGERATCAVHPGMVDWALDEAQRLIFDLVEPAPGIVRLSESGQMCPCKSLSFVVGIGSDVDERDAGCAACTAASRCHWRRPRAS